MHARRIGVPLLYPGWLGTCMGGPDVMLAPTQSVRGMRTPVAKLQRVLSGCVFRYNGIEIFLRLV